VQGSGSLLRAARSAPAILFALMAIAMCVAAPPATADSLVGSLGESQSVFWPGAFVSSARVGDPSMCAVQGPCFDYKIAVTADHAKVLRAGLASTDDSNGWGLHLLDPAGHEVAYMSTYTLGGVAEDFDAEVWAHNPAPGEWTVRVVPENVLNGDFKARAAVDPSTTPPTLTPSLLPAVVVPSTHKARLTCHMKRKHGHKVKVCAHAHRAHVRHHAHSRRAKHATANSATATSTTATTARVRAGGVYDMPPDLAADPPWHLTFQQPLPMAVVEGGNFAAILGAHNTDTSVAGQPTYGCLAEETVEQGAKRCLRFTSGFASLGPGPFEVFGSSNVPVALNGGPLYQNVYRSDGSHYSRPAGSFAFHPVHAHYHVLGIAQFEFFRVMPDHSLVKAGNVLKEGFCLGNIKMYDWHSFAQSEIDPSSVDNCEPSLQPDGSYRFYEGITNGWEDSYKWQTSGQFIDFGNNPDGYYVLRVTVNPFKYLLENDAANDTNNVAYAYMQVWGNDVRVIERGHGAGPFHPNKTVVDPVITG
jgi:hypothetical protein